jgi:hypothetical protein
MSIKAYSSIVQNLSSSNYFDIYDESLNKIRFTLRDSQLYITSYNPTTGEWTPANVIFDNTTSQSNDLIDFQDIFNANNVRVDLDIETQANGSELMIFENANNLNYLKRSGLNYAINSSPYKPTIALDDRAVIYQLDAEGKPRMTLSNISLNNLSQNFVTLSDAQTISGVKTFSANKLLLGGVDGNVTLNGSQTAGSASYTLEYPAAAPSGVLNVLTTSGSSPYSKLTWTDLNATYAALSSFDQLSALNTTGSPTFANLTINTNGALNLNYMSTPASSDVLATLNTNKQLTNSGVSLSTLCTLGSAQTFSADKTFNYSAGKIKLSNYATDNTSTNNILTVNASGYVVPCNKLYSDIVDVSSTQTISGAKTFSAAITLSGTNTDTSVSSGQKLAVLNTTTNSVERVNITPDILVTTSGTQTITGDKTFSGTTRTISLQNHGNAVQRVITSTGIITFNSNGFLKWTTYVRMLCADWSNCIQGFVRIACPTSGTITFYKGDNTVTTVTCTSDGIPMTPTLSPAALYLNVSPTDLSELPASKLILVDNANNSFRVSDSWILIAVAIRDGATPLSIKWVPGMVDIPIGCTYNSPLAKINRSPFIVVNTTTESMAANNLFNVKFSDANASSAQNGLSYSNTSRSFTNTTSGTLLVLVNYTVAYTFNNSGIRKVWIETSTNAISGENVIPATADSFSGNFMNGSGIVSLGAGDSFWIKSYHTANANISLIPSSTKCIATLL